MRISIFILMFLLILITCACQDQAAPVPVLVQDSGSRDIEAFGTVSIQKEQALSLDFPVKITSINVSEGQLVEMGQSLATLDFGLWEEEKNNIVQEMALLKKEITLLQNQVKEKESALEQRVSPDIQRLLFLIQAQESKREDLYKEYTHRMELVKSGSYPAQTLQEMESSIKELDMELKSLEFSVKSQEYQLKSEVDRLKETLYTSRMKFEPLEYKLVKLNDLVNRPCIQDGHLISIIEKGLVGEIRCIQGSTIPASQPIFILQDLNSLTIIAEVNEQFIDRVVQGSKAYVIPDANREYEFRERVTFISSRAIHRSGETIIPVHITLNQGNTFLKPGYNVQIYIESAGDGS